jgi:hypothetical protein
MTFFGKPWDSPACDDAIAGPTPLGERCQDCQEPIEQGDQGFMIPTVRLGEDGEPVGSLEPTHRECLTRMVVGSIAHLEGRCTCHGIPIKDGREERSIREQGRDTMQWLEEHAEPSWPPPQFRPRPAIRQEEETMSPSATTMVAYLRWQADEPRLSRTIHQPDPHHPITFHACPGCQQPLGGGRLTQLLALGPYNEEDEAKHQAGRWYSAIAVAIHEGCASEQLLADQPDNAAGVAALLVQLGADPGWVDV